MKRLDSSNKNVLLLVYGNITSKPTSKTVLDQQGTT
jgi:hypothetical protein